jgi:hypothetical protein
MLDPLSFSWWSNSLKVDGREQKALEQSVIHIAVNCWCVKERRPVEIALLTVLIKDHKGNNSHESKSQINRVPSDSRPNGSDSSHQMIDQETVSLSQ